MYRMFVFKSYQLMTYKECKEYVRSDYYRIEGRRDSVVMMLLRTIWNPGFQFMFWWRFSHLRGGRICFLD